VRALVTGGAGFIGSSIVDVLVQAGHEAVVLDDLSTGFAEHVRGDVPLFKGDVADEALVRKACEDVEVVFHHAASRAVFRSVEDPLAPDMTNSHGTLTVLKAALDNGVRRVIYASSSSVYGGLAPTPTPESAPVMPVSPYGVTKLAGEHYCRVFAELYDIETVALRYFNVYGPRQRPDSAYAAVIPLFIDALQQGRRPEVHGDGKQSRDFTYIDDVVAANLAAAASPEVGRGEVLNIAGGQEHSLLDLLEILGRICGVTPDPEFTASRAGDVRRSSADASLAHRLLGFETKVDFEEGLRRTVDWFSHQS
jgi:UDP-glucose 4-epimerase